MAINSGNVKDRELGKFVESPTRTGQPAVESVSTIKGITDSGSYISQKYTQEGHQEMAIHEPLLPFGSIHAEGIKATFQSDATYGLNSQEVNTVTSLGGSVTVSDSMFLLSSGTTVGAQGVVQSRKRLRYRHGQGVLSVFTALYNSPVASSYQIAGCGHSEDGFYIGYVGISFGILYSNRGVREVRTLTVTTASSTSENITIKLNGTDYLVAVTNSGNIQRTVWEISQGTFGVWNAYPVGATVVFINGSAGPKSGVYSLTGSTAVGTFAQTKLGVLSTDAFTAQSSFNGDKLDGTGASGVTIDPTKLNLFRIKVKSGTGDVDFQVRISTSNNNPTWITFHTLRFPNTLTTTSISNPSFPFTAAVYSDGSTTNLTMKIGSFSGFFEGTKILNGPRFSYFGSSTSVGDTNYQALFTVMNSRYYGGRTNQSVINIQSVNAALKHTSPTIFYLIRNASLVGNPNFSSYDTNSCSLKDNSATTVTVTNNNQIIWSGHLGDTGNLDHNFDGGANEELTLQPGEWLTLAAKSVTGTPAYVTGSINTREDQ